jgi:long-chain-fatty-acid--CoA ligase ACSBG
LYFTQFDIDLNKTNGEKESKYNINEYLENDKFKDYTILDYLKVIAKDYPRKIALKTKNGKNKIGWNSIDYVNYYKNIVGFSQSLYYWFNDKVNVGILGFNSPGWFYAHFGCMLNGGISVGLYSTNSKELCKKIIDNADISVLVVEDDIQLEKFIGMKMPNIKLIIYYSPISDKMINKFSIPLLSMGNFMSKKSNTKIKPTKLKDIATLIYTSGTTDEPKGVIITHLNIMTSIKRMLYMIKTKSSITKFTECNYISYLPLNHITAQLIDMYMPIITLGTVWFADKNALKTSLKETLLQVRPNCFVGVPRIWEKIHQQVSEYMDSEGLKGQFIYKFMASKILEKMGLDKCTYAISAGGPLMTTTYEFFKKMGLQINDIYGMSETCGPISININGFFKPNSVGYPIMALKIEEDGEILVNGLNLSNGYYKKTKSFTKNGWFKTGDIGMLDNDGFLYITGRKKDMIITSGGENIYPTPIENKFYEYLNKYFEYVMIIGNKLKFLSILLINSKKLPLDINNIIENVINDVNKYAPTNVHTIKKYLILTDRFTVGNELTPTMKIKREYVQKKYMNKIMTLYS